MEHLNRERELLEDARQRELLRDKQERKLSREKKVENRKSTPGAIAHVSHQSKSLLQASVNPILSEVKLIRDCTN
jgi:hypothetical protein